MGIGPYSEERAPVEGCWEMIEPEAFARVADTHLVRESVSSDSELRKARLLKTVEAEIIPRLLMAGRAARQDVTTDQLSARPTEDDVIELARLLLLHDAAVSLALVDTLRRRGMGLEVICLELLAPAARHLGLLWEDDRVTFMQVTVGLCRLHGLLREINPAFRTPGFADPRERARRALLMPTPGEQHTFGLLMVGDFMRRAGWEIWTDFPGTKNELAVMVSNNWFAVVGLSLGSELRLGELASVIKSVRRESRNQSIGVMVGGPIFLSHPEYVGQVGADTMGADARQATECADHVFSRFQSLS